MPSKIPKLGGYGFAWKRKRKSMLARQPLCVICQAAGRIVPATIVDHKIPLADGGTNDESNLQPLCKLCHDALKTPADRRERAARGDVQLIAVWLENQCPAECIDLRDLRTAIAEKIGYKAAHQVMLAAAQGMVQHWVNSNELPLTICHDDAAAAKMMHHRFGIQVAIEAVGEPHCRGVSEKDKFLDSRYGVERLARANPVIGTQQQRVENRT